MIEEKSPTRSPRRLCMLLHGPFPPDPRVARQVRVAVENGWQVEVIAMRQPGQARKEMVDGALVRRLPLAHRWGTNAVRVVGEYAGFTALACVVLAGLLTRRRYDVVQVHNPPDFLIAAAVLPKLLGSRVILDIHDLSSDMFSMRFGGRPGAGVADRVLRFVERTATRVANAVITVHEPYRRELVARGVPADKVTVVMNSVDEQLLSELGERGRGSGLLIVYPGMVTPPYGVHLLVEALAQIADEVPDARLEIYGDGDSLPQIRALAERLDVADRVELSRRFLPQREVIARIASASVGVIPNLPTPLNRFALSTKLFEFVALGVPVVAAGLPTMREYFSDRELLFFEAGDAAALAAALLEVARDPQAAERRALAARRRYDAYRWPIYGRRYLELLSPTAWPT
jgi:glycosyltransferase involved in cell wall biosynthesis